MSIWDAFIDDYEHRRKNLLKRIQLMEARLLRTGNSELGRWITTTADSLAQAKVDLAEIERLLEEAKAKLPGRFAASFLIPMRIMVMTAQALGILILHEKRLLTLVRFDVINVARGFGPTLNGTFSALRFCGKPVPLDRLQNG